MKVIFVCKEYFQTEDEKVYFFELLEKEISVERIQITKPIKRISLELMIQEPSDNKSRKEINQKVCDLEKKAKRAIYF